MNMKYKLICTDMDGTLLGENHTVSENNKNALRKASELGIKVAITTGRLFTSAKAYADLVGVEAPIISANGAYIREKDKNEVIYESILKDEQLESIYKVMKKHGLLGYFNTSDSVITEEELPETHGYVMMNKNLSEDRRVKIQLVDDFKIGFKKNKDKILKSIMFGEEEKLAEVRKELSEEGSFELVSSWRGNLEVMQKGTTKGNAVKILAQKLGIKREEIICIGDGENDLSMIEYAGLGVAMSNAEEYVKEKADYVTDTNVNDGVAKMIEQFILK